MSTSAIKKHYIHGAVVSFLFSALCVLFTVVFYQNSHKVYSDYMTYMFLVPLVGGTVVYLLLLLLSDLVKPSRLAFNLYNSALAMLCCGLCSYGIFEISGGDSPYAVLFYYFAIAFAFPAVFAFVIAQFTKKKDA